MSLFDNDLPLTHNKRSELVYSRSLYIERWFTAQWQVSETIRLVSVEATLMQSYPIKELLKGFSGRQTKGKANISAI